ncbi:MAG: HEAT repeat domain-containing protein, partial [Gemmatales bacterium]
KAAEPAIAALITALSDTEAGVRAEAAQALGNLGPTAEEAIPSLQRLLMDRDARVQEQAVVALRRMGPLAAASIASLLTVAESTKAETTLRQAALITIESIWPTGLKEPGSWNRLQALAQSEKDAAVKAAAQQAEKKIGTLRK